MATVGQAALEHLKGGCSLLKRVAKTHLQDSVWGKKRNVNYLITKFKILIICCCSVAKLYPTLYNPMDCSTSGFPVPQLSPGICSHSCPLSQLMSSNHLILYHLLLLPSIFPNIRVFSNESALRIRWPKYWCFSVSISPSKEYSGLISFRIDWFDLLAVQGTLFKSLLQHYSLKSSVLRSSTFFMVQLSHPYMTTGKTIALTRRIFVHRDVSAF